MDSSVPYINPWTGLDFSTLRKIRSYVESLGVSIPKNGNNRPLKIVNVNTLIDTGLTVDSKHLVDYPPEGLYLDVGFEDGFPTIDGIGIWNQIEGEPIECYNLFKAYRNMKSIEETRSISKLSKQTNVSPSMLEMIRRIFNWSYRVDAYEEFRQYERDQLLEERRIEVQGRHAKAAEKLFNISMDYIEKNANLMTPISVLKALEIAVKLERLSIGMSSDKRESIYNPSGSSINFSVNNIQSSGQSGSVVIGGRDIATGSTGDLEQDQDSVAQILNIMDQIGIFNEKDNVIEGEYQDVTED